MKHCFYCGNKYIKDTEHVFPDGLGGQRLYISCVCENCNNEFSALERELYQKGIISLMRSVEGITAQKQQNKSAYLKAPVLLTFDEKNKIVYEVNQNNEFKVSLKPQIIEIESKFYVEGASIDELKKLTDKIKLWIKNNLKMVTKFPDKKGDVTSCIQFEINNDLVTSNEINIIDKINHPMLLDVLSEHELSPFLRPRIFLDKANELRIRAATLEDAIEFVKKLLLFIPKKISLRSFSKESINDNGKIYVELSFNSIKSERAMVKILLNCLIHYFPESIHNNGLNVAKSFVKNESFELKRSIGQKNEIFDSVDKTHNIFFYQHHNNLWLRLSLFNGQFSYNIMLENVQIPTYFQYQRLIIDYSNRINKIETQNDILNTFSKL